MTFEGVTVNPLLGVLVVPAVAAALSAVLPDYRATARLNVLATAATLICALELMREKEASRCVSTLLRHPEALFTDFYSLTLSS